MEYRRRSRPGLLKVALKILFVALRTPKTKWKSPLVFMVAIGFILSVVDTLIGAISPAPIKATIIGLIALDVGLLIIMLFDFFILAGAQNLRDPLFEMTCKGPQTMPAFRLLIEPGRTLKSLIADHAEGDPLPVERVASTELNEGDLIVVVAGEMIPADGEILARTPPVGESASLLRGFGGNRSSVTRGTVSMTSCMIVRVGMVQILLRV
jgi:K+-transporting ATPase ATPase B chain